MGSISLPPLLCSNTILRKAEEIMGADNWGICPECKKTGVKSLENKEKELMKSYGKVPLEKFDEMRLNFQKDGKKILNPDTNLREEYKLGINDDGMFRVSYSANCSICGFSHKYEHSEPTKLK